MTSIALLKRRRRKARASHTAFDDLAAAPPKVIDGFSEQLNLFGTPDKWRAQSKGSGIPAG